MESMPLVPELVRQLRGFCGHRTLWLDDEGQVTHAEPEYELEAEGYRYVATLFRPGPEELAEALARVGVRPVAKAVPTSAAQFGAVPELA